MRWRCPECGRDGGDQPAHVEAVMCFNTTKHPKRRTWLMQPENEEEENE